VKYIRKTVPTLLLAAVALLSAANTQALPCNGRAVNPGESKEEVAAKCGEAMFKDERTVEVDEIVKNRIRSSEVKVIDEWAFDFGPNELMQSYRFENGKLVEIRNIGYGRQHDDQNDTCRNGELLAVGDSSLDTFIKCGEPIAKEHLANKVIETTSDDKKLRTTIPVAEWTYRYGPDALGYTLRIENGVVREIRTREFGK